MRQLLWCSGGWIAGRALLSGALCLLPAGALAQAAAIATHGTVIGRVLCSDTNGPARFASVMLQPVILPKSAVAPHDPNNHAHEVSKVYQTGLDGTVVMPTSHPATTTSSRRSRAIAPAPRSPASRCSTRPNRLHGAWPRC